MRAGARHGCLVRFGPGWHLLTDVLSLRTSSRVADCRRAQGISQVESWVPHGQADKLPLLSVETVKSPAQRSKSATELQVVPLARLLAARAEAAQLPLPPAHRSNIYQTGGALCSVLPAARCMLRANSLCQHGRHTCLILSLLKSGFVRLSLAPRDTSAGFALAGMLLSQPSAQDS